MKNQFIKCMIVILSVAVFLICVGTPTQAYTEEEKQQAKAWLSSHGYSPDASGAQQAYQDYLNGKFDDELGVTREETTEGTDTSTENTTEKVAEEEQTEERTATESDQGSAKSPSGTTESKTASSGTENPTTGQSAEAEKKDTEEKSTVEKNSEEVTTEDNAKEEEEISVYRKKENTKRLLMIAFCVVLFAIVIFSVIKLTKKENKEI